MNSLNLLVLVSVILIQGRPGSGKTTLVNRLTKEWSNKTEKSKITDCPLLLRVTLRELKMEHPSGENLSLLDILHYSMSDDIKHIDGELEQYLSEPKNTESLCIIFDGLDEYPPAYSDPSNYIYKIIERQKLRTATVIVLSRPVAYETFFETSGTSGFQAYELAGFNNNGIIEYVFKNIPDREHAERFLCYLDKKPAIYQLCNSPLHLTMFVESFKDKNEFPLTLTEAYITSLSKAIKRELGRKNQVGCSIVRLDDLPSLRLCNRDLADTIINVSRLAFDSLTAHDHYLNITVNRKKIRLAQTHFSLAELHSYLPSGDYYGLLSPLYYKDNYETLIGSFTFPHIVIQQFWAAYFYVTIPKTNVFDLEEHIFVYSNLLYFVCGMYSNINATMLHKVFELLLQIEWSRLIYDYTTCGFESGHSIQSLVDIYLKLQGTALKLDDLMYSSSYQAKVLSFLTIIHVKIKHLIFTQHSSSLRLYVDACNKIDLFPNLETISVQLLLAEPRNAKYPSDFLENLRLVLSREKSISKLEWTMPLRVLTDDNFYSCLDGVFDIATLEIKVIIIGSLVQVPKSYESCCSNSKMLSHVVKTTPKMFITALTKFTSYFHKQLSVMYLTMVWYLECQQIQALFEALYKSSFNNEIQIFEMTDVCLKLLVTSIIRHGRPVVRITVLHNSSHSSGDDWHTRYLINGQITEDFKLYESCGNRQLYTFFPNNIIIDCF